MLLHFSKRLRLLIWSIFMWIKFQLMPLFSVVAVTEAFPATSPSAASKSSSSASVSSSSGHFIFSLSPWRITIYIGLNSIILAICSCIFCRVYYVFESLWFLFLVLSISYLLSYWFCPSCLFDFVNFCDLFFVCVERAINRFPLIALSYQPSFNNSIRIYFVYEFTTWSQSYLL